MTKYLLFVLLPILFYACNSEQNQRLPPAEGRSLQPSSDYPEYWSWDGNTPTLLLGGSSSAAPFLEEDWKEELNYLVKAGGNYVNFAMPVSTTPGRNPFISTEDKSGNINVDSEKQYWKKLDEYLSHANDLSVVVEIQVWDHANFSAENREKNAWTAAGGMADTLLPREFVAGEHPFLPQCDLQRPCPLQPGDSLDGVLGEIHRSGSDGDVRLPWPKAQPQHRRRSHLGHQRRHLQPQAFTRSEYCLSSPRT
jgi:hypothetical protein